jgi:GDP-L-fucose synthase
MSISRDARVFVAGHNGLVGSALWRELSRAGFRNLVGRSHAELDLTDSRAVRAFFEETKPEYVLLAAARVGGILANESQPVPFLLENLQIQNNVLAEAHRIGVSKLLFLGSSCIYPRLSPQPIAEESLLTGPLEETNQWYAVAKIAGIKLAQAYRRQHGRDFICAMPTNLYGPGDNYNLQGSHVLPAFIRKFHEAKVAGSPKVTLWGTGTPRREFLFVDDLARACLLLLEHYSHEQIVNVGCGSDVTVRELAGLVAREVGFGGEILWDSSKPDGTPRKLLDSSRIFGMGWRPSVDLAKGIGMAYADYLARGGARG